MRKHVFEQTSLEQSGHTCLIVHSLARPKSEMTILAGLSLYLHILPIISETPNKQLIIFGGNAGRRCKRFHVEIIASMEASIAGTLL